MIACSISVWGWLSLEAYLHVERSAHVNRVHILVPSVSKSRHVLSVLLSQISISIYCYCIYIVDASALAKSDGNALDKRNQPIKMMKIRNEKPLTEPESEVWTCAP